MRRLVAPLAMSVSLVLAAPLYSQQRTTYTVRDGDILGSIAERHGVTVAELREWNDLDGDMIRVGQELSIRAGGSSSAGSSTSSYRTYTVRSGDTLSGIAGRHDVSVADLVSWNRGLDPDRIRVGQEIRIASFGRAERRVTYVVEPGDFVGAIARDHGVTVEDISRWNGNLDPDRVRIGQELVLWIERPEQESESVGAASSGRLVNGEQLPQHRAYQVRDPSRAWGTNLTITAMLEGFDHMASEFRDLPRVSVHDISHESGGEIGDHRSHESGRDVDVGYYHDGCSRDCEYRRVSAEQLDVEKQWELFHYWIRHDFVVYIFVDYELQEPLYNWLQQRGASRTELQRWFQYPRGRDAAAGILRHEPGHRDHFHVRFECPASDRNCR